PVDHLGDEIEVEPLDHLLDVADAEIGIPAGVAMEHQRPETEFLLGDIGDVRTVETAADADDAVVIPSLAFTLDRLDERHDLGHAAFIGMPVRLDAVVEVAAILAPAAPVELERRIAGVHHAIGTDLIRSAGHSWQNARSWRCKHPGPER